MYVHFLLAKPLCAFANKSETNMSFIYRDRTRKSSWRIFTRRTIFGSVDDILVNKVKMGLSSAMSKVFKDKSHKVFNP